jgi:hypothetical protein
MTYSRFRHLAIERAGPAPTAAQICAIETLLGASLPASFVDFLAVANGGYLEYAIDVAMENGSTEPLSFCGLFSADDGDFCDETFVGEIRSGRAYAKIPMGVLPFARDGGGSIVYLDLSPEGQGRVVAFVVGLPGWTGLRQESAFLTLASSFDEYADKLYLDREATLDHLEYDATESSHVQATEEYLDIGQPSWRSDEELVNAIDDARSRISGT